jgi:hypothetical protein
MSDLRLPVEVDPWSDGRWSRVERELFDKIEGSDAEAAALERPRAVRRRVALAGAFAAVAVAAAVVLLLPPAGILRSSERMRVVTTDSASEVTVGESSLFVAPRSLVMVSGDDEHGVDVVLDRGSVTCEVAPRRGRPAFVVDAGDVRVRVVGTRFTVAREGADASVVVDHGVVEVSASGKVIVMHDGERWRQPSGPGGPESGIVPVSPPAAAASASAVPLQREVPQGASQAPGPPPRASLATPSRARAAALVAPPAASTEETSRDRHPPADETFSASEAPTVPPTSAQAAYEAAARIEKMRPDDAASLYRQVIVGDTAWTPSAMFALGRLEAERGQRQEATGLLREYLARYPHGINADDARALLQRMQ